jgi:hypothetical protein
VIARCDRLPEPTQRALIACQIQTGLGQTWTDRTYEVFRGQDGLDLENDMPIALGGVGGRVLGFEVPAKVTVGRSSARLKVAMPIGRYDRKTQKITPVKQKENLLGHDFLQATKATIDFSRGDDEAFVEGELRADDVVKLRISRLEALALDRWATAEAARRRGRSHSTKKSGRQLDREIAEALAKKRVRKAR